MPATSPTPAVKRAVVWLGVHGVWVSRLGPDLLPLAADPLTEWHPSFESAAAAMFRERAAFVLEDGLLGGGYYAVTKGGPKSKPVYDFARLAATDLAGAFAEVAPVARPERAV